MSSSGGFDMQNALDEAVAGFRYWAYEGQPDGEPDRPQYHTIWGGCSVTAGLWRMSEAWGLYWALNAIASYQSSTIMETQYWSLERDGDGAKLYLTPVNRNNGQSLPKFLVQEFDRIPVDTPLFGHGATIRIWCQVDIDEETGNRRPIIHLPGEA